MHAIRFEREMREGLDDCRYMLTLARLPCGKGDRAAAALIETRLGAFKLGQPDLDALFPPSDWREFRLQMAEHIERLR